MRLVLGILGIAALQILVALWIIGCAGNPAYKYKDGTDIVSSKQLDAALFYIQARSGLYSFGHWIGPVGDCKVRARHLETALHDAFSVQGIYWPFIERQTVWDGKQGHKVVLVLTADGGKQIDPNTGGYWNE